MMADAAESKDPKILPRWWKRSLLAGTLGGVLAGVATAGAPIAFDQYTVSNGAITPKAGSCTSPGFGVTYTCKTGVTDQGMLQREVTVEGWTGANAKLNGTYIQFIITDPDATGDAGGTPFSAARDNLDFTNEDWIKMHSRGASIASKQTIVESNFTSPTLEDRFVNVTSYEFGDWAQTHPIFLPWVDIQQEVSQVDYSGVNPKEIFRSDANISNNGNPSFTTDFRVALSQTVDLSTPGHGPGVQGFDYVKAAGSFQTSSNAVDPLLPGGTNGGSVTWSVGDPVTAMWVGQRLDIGGGVVTKFGHTKYSADTTQYIFPPGVFVPVTSTSRLTSFTDPNPVNWNLLDTYVAGTFNTVPLFGLPPSLPSVPITVTGTPTPTAGSLLPTVAAGSAPVGSTTPVPLPVNAYNEWTVSGGVFTVQCNGVGVFCGPPIVNEGGLFQRVVSVGGVEYIQTIITDTNATGNASVADFQPGALAFKNETFTRRVSGGGHGIAANLHLAEQDLSYQSQSPTTTPLPSTGGQFAYNTQLKTGWANGGPTDPTMIVDQRVLVPETTQNQTSSMDNIFHLEQGAGANDQRMELASTVGTQTGGNGFTQPIMFATSKVTGAFQGTTHSTSTDPVLLTGPNATNGGNIDWAQYDAIQVSWIGAEYPTPDPFGPSRVATTSYTNLSSGARTDSTSITTTPPDPESWVAPFGVAPPFSPATMPAYPAGGVYSPPAFSP